MTFRAVDKSRFAYLLSLGAGDYELRKFFTDCRVKLIQRGVKVQNLPHGEKARIRVITNELPTSADEVLRNWFSEHLTMSDPELPDVIVDTYKLHEEVGEDIEETLARRLARSCLVHLSSEVPPPVLLEFLRSPITGAGNPSDLSEIAAPSPLPTSNAKQQLEKLPQLLVALVQGKDVDEYLDGLPVEIASLVSGLQAASSGRLKEAYEALDALPGESNSREKLEQYLKQQETRQLREVPRGVSIAPLEDFGDSFDDAADEILGYCTKSDPPNAVFVQPMVVLQGRSFKSLTTNVRISLFPKNGDVMAFAGAAYPRQPRRGEMGIWRIKEHQTDKATHFHLNAETRKIYEVFSVPFPSTDYDSVREFLKEHAEAKSSSRLQSPIYVLSDGLIIGARLDKPDLSKDETFESGLSAWKALPGIRLEGRLFVVGPLPSEHGIYECASIANSIRKVLRPYIKAGKNPAALSGLTRAQLGELVQFIGAGEAQLTMMRIQRIRSELELISQSQEALETLVEELLTDSTVRQRIDALVIEAAEREASQQTQMKVEISRLIRERGEWEEKIKKQKEEHKRLREDTSKVVKAAFEKARTDSVATLADLAVFQELTNSNNKREEGHFAAPVFQPIAREDINGAVSIVAVMKSIGVESRKATAFSAIGDMAFALGLIICIRGIGARHLVRHWARALGKGVLVDVTVGLIDDTPINTYLNNEQQPEVMAFLDANLSAIDIYARPICDFVVETAIKRDVRSPMAILFSLSDGVGHLPLPNCLEPLSISLDLDGKYNFNERDLGQLMQNAFDPVEGVLTTRLWSPTVEKVRAYISTLDSEAQGLVLSVLTTTNQYRSGVSD